MNTAVTNDTLALLKAAQATPNETLAKAFTQSGSAVSGLTAYDLEAGAKSLFPVLTPLRNQIPRVSANGGIQANWRAITNINVNSISAGLGQGNRGGIVTTSTKDYIAAYKGIGLEDSVTFEAEYSAEGYADLRATAARNLLSALMIQEERIILGGNASLALGTTPTPTVTGASTGGTIGAGTYLVWCVALSYEGYVTSSISGGVPASVTRTNTDSSTDTYGGGSARKSASGSSGAITGTGVITASVTPVAGAVGYAWYVGISGSEVLTAITSINSVRLTTLAGAGTQNISTMPASDNSQNALIFDGLLTFCSDGASGSYRAAMATGTAGTGTPLTQDGTGGVVEIDAALKSFWDNYRLSPDEIWVSAQEQQNISVKVLAGNANTAQRFTFNVDQGMIAGGTSVRSYLNKYTMAGVKEIPIKLHPNMPNGTLLFVTKQLPYPLSNVTNVLQVRTRRDYYQIEWPLRSRKYEFGVYADEVLQNYFPPAFGIITNIANG